VRIDLNNIDKNSFNIKEYNLNGEIVSLINPKDFSCTWTRQNLNLRSTLVNSEGDIISLGYLKFFNHCEKPDLYPNPESYKDWTILDKIDGSLLIVSKYKNNLICRTRGVVDAKIHENGYEIGDLFKKYSNIDNCKLFPEYSLLLEWVSPTQRIVLDYPEPDLYLLAAIRHEDCVYLSEKEIDELSLELGLKRPQKFEFRNIAEIAANCEILKGREGYVLAFNNNQNRIKLKADAYLLLHKFKSQATLENTIDLFFSYGCPSFNDFQRKLKETFDEDCKNLVIGFCSKIVDAYKEVKDIEDGFDNFVSCIQGESRKEQAAKILSSFGKTSRSGMVFTRLDKKPLNENEEKKLLYQCLKK
jgi:hypothetical protein